MRRGTCQKVKHQRRYHSDVDTEKIMRSVGGSTSCLSLRSSSGLTVTVLPVRSGQITARRASVSLQYR